VDRCGVPFATPQKFELDATVLICLFFFLTVIFGECLSIPACREVITESPKVITKTPKVITFKRKFLVRLEFKFLRLRSDFRVYFMLEVYFDK